MEIDMNALAERITEPETWRCAMGDAHYWRIDAADKHPSSKVLRGRCAKCDERRTWPRNPIGIESPTERRMTGLINAGIW